MRGRFPTGLSPWSEAGGRTDKQVVLAYKDKTRIPTENSAYPEMAYEAVDRITNELAFRS